MLRAQMRARKVARGISCDLWTGAGMSMILHIDAWKLGAAFFILMLCAGWAGLRIAPEPRTDGGDHNTRITDASLALFALLLAFTFSGAADRFENRKGFLLDEAIAIGDFAATASMLEEASRDRIRELLARYVQERLRFGSTRIDDPQMEIVTTRSRALQREIQDILHDAVTEKQSPTIHTPLMNGFNAVTMTHDRALYGSRNQVSDTIILLLVLFGIVSAFLIGYTTSRSARRGSLLGWMTVYTVLVTAVFTVTMDMEQPHRGIIMSSKAPLLDLLASLEPTSAPATDAAGSR